jgi:GTP cyclohydrolase II
MRRSACRRGSFRLVSFGTTGAVAGRSHIALVRGDPAGDEVLVRVHSECLWGDVLGSLRCDCGEQRDRALARIAAAGRGVLVYLRGHEGRGIGLNAKLRAYALQEAGPRHRRYQPGARAPRRRPRLLAGGGDPATAGCAQRPAADQQPPTRPPLWPSTA